MTLDADIFYPGGLGGGLRRPGQMLLGSFLLLFFFSWSFFGRGGGGPNLPDPRIQKRI